MIIETNGYPLVSKAVLWIVFLKKNKGKRGTKTPYSIFARKDESPNKNQLFVWKNNLPHLNRKKTLPNSAAENGA
jgi:hypothetical protein